jgi:hypothetical protein
MQKKERSKMGITGQMRAGYIFGVKEPETGKYVYIGLSRRPWEYLYRMVNSRKICPAFFDWIHDVFERYPLGVEILGEVVADRYWAQINGDPVPPLPEKHPYKTLIEWEVIGMQDEEGYDMQARISVSTPSLRSRIIKKYKAEGHPIFTKTAGRPKKNRELQED